ncbi:bacteriocin-like protein [Chryseobacterium sp. MIQD13]|uniref:bacteriocin-like protein n=1 Tax=Chryseobacterium sp. MIQD13 TaxID=3422310 RepID=UPI003D2A384E
MNPNLINMKKSNLKKLSRKEQKTIKGSGIVRKCSTSSQCWPGECCDGGSCIASPYPMCEPLE